MAYTRMLPDGSVAVETGDVTRMLLTGEILVETVEPPVVVDAGGWKPLGGDVSHWLEPLPPEIEKIIEEVAEKEAAKDDPVPPSKVKIAPLKTALRMADFQYKPDYSDLYRVAYEKAYERLLLERDEEEALFLLM